jgi:hypothetical protein
LFGLFFRHFAEAQFLFDAIQSVGPVQPGIGACIREMLGTEGRDFRKLDRLIGEETALHAKPSYRNVTVLDSLKKRK